MLFGKEKKHSEAHFLVIDIGSASVGTALCYSNLESDKPVILYTHREFIPPRVVRSSERKLHVVRDALIRAVKDLVSANIPLEKTQKILVVSSAPWAHLVTRMVTVHKEKPTVFDRESIQTMLAEAEKAGNFKDKENQLHAEYAMHVIERELVSIRQNGYRVPELSPTPSTELMVAQLTGLIPKELLSVFIEAEKGLSLRAEKEFHTHGYVLFDVLRSISSQTENCLIYDITGELSDVHVVKDGVLMRSYSADNGFFDMARIIAKDLKTLPEEALAHMRRSNEEHHEHVADALEKALTIAAERFTATYMDMRKTFAIPPIIYLVTRPDFEGFYKEVIDRSFIEEGKPRGLTIHAIEYGTLEPHVAYTTSNRDVFLAMHALFFHNRSSKGHSRHF